MDVIAQREFSLPASRVWTLLADFGATDWLSAYFYRVDVEGSGIGMVRRLYQTADGHPAVHRLESVNHDKKTICWSIHQTVFIPVDTIDAETRVESLPDDHCRVISRWSFEQPEDADLDELYTVTEQWVLGAMTLMERYLSANQ
ncbi:MAG: hypothetical protein ACI9G5_000958 [Paracoccaceae bacterium]|jgi:hypothetical protein